MPPAPSEALRRARCALIPLATLMVLTAGIAGPGTLLADPLADPQTPDGALSAANPYVSFLPVGVEPDMDFWEKFMAQRAADRRAVRRPAIAGGSVAEVEPNDTPAQAQLLADFGTAAGQARSLDVAGSFAAGAAPAALGPFAEDEGSIPLATDTGLVVGGAVRISGTIGDGPFGSGGTGSGDLDFFRIPGVRQGELIVVDVDSAPGNLDSFLALHDSAGNFVVLNEDENALNRDGFIAASAPRDDDYYLSIAGSIAPFASVLSDPFDSSTGFGVGSEGDYSLEIRLESGDSDWYAFDLSACDILGVNLQGGGDQLLLESPSGVLTVASTLDLSAAYPPASPLPGGGEATFAVAVEEAGTYRLRVLGVPGTTSSYALELRLHRPTERSGPGLQKTLFLDFDGASFDTSIFPINGGELVTLSPLADFLGRWGLGPGDEDAVIDATLRAARENLESDPLGGPNPSFGLEIRNSRDHVDPFGGPGVSRVIVGGSIPELGIPTIGIAQSIDVGNFESSETAVVLLDLLSGNDFDPNSLNGFPVDPSTTKIEFVGRSLGNIIAHEVGHYTGAFHTEQLNPQADLMDRGGNLPNTLGVGQDLIFGTADDVDVDFGHDLYNDAEGFAGFESTLAAVACGYLSGAVIFRDEFESGDTSAWSELVISAPRPSP